MGNQVLRSEECVTHIMMDDLSEEKKHEGKCNGMVLNGIWLHCSVAHTHYTCRAEETKEVKIRVK
jgi:hypothetical protein